MAVGRDSTSRRMLVVCPLPVVFLAVGLLASSGCVVVACPSRCVCQGPGQTSVVCAVLDLAAVPKGLSASTRLLTISGSPSFRFSLSRLSRTDLSHLKSLVSLKISFTELTTVDEDALIDLVSLKRIELSNNKISVILPNTFSGLRNLTFISLSNNPGVALQDRVFWNLPALSELYLSGVGLSELHSVMFYGLSALRKLDVSSNGLSAFSPDVLLAMKNLWSLDLSFNELTSLDPLLEPFFTRLKRVLLGGNRWQCNCLLKWLQKYPHVVAPAITDPVTCAAPPSLQFRHLADVDESLLTCEPPIIHSCPSKVSVYEGDTMVIRCHVTGDPYPAITWTFADGSSLISGVYPGMPMRDRAAVRVGSAPETYGGKLAVSASNSVGVESAEIVVEIITTTTSWSPLPTTTTTTSATATATETSTQSSSIASTLSSTESAPRNTAEISTGLPSEVISESSTMRPSRAKGALPLTTDTSHVSTSLPADHSPQSASVSIPPPQQQPAPVADSNVPVIALAGVAAGAAIIVAVVMVIKVAKKLAGASASSKVAPSSHTEVPDSTMHNKHTLY